MWKRLLLTEDSEESVQGEDKENYSAFIAVGAEEQTHSSDGLTIAGNDARFVPNLSRRASCSAESQAPAQSPLNKDRKDP